jgi:radical SAM family protein
VVWNFRFIGVRVEHMQASRHIASRRHTEKQTVLLIHPPLSKPCEPPAGLARLASALNANRVHCRIMDANLEGLLDLLTGPVSAEDTWSKRAVRNVSKNLDAIRNHRLYANTDRYKRAVNDLNRILALSGHKTGVALSFSNYTETHLSPVRSADLMQAAEQFEKNLFYPGLSRRLCILFDDQHPDIVGISINYLSQALTGFAVAGFVKKMLPQTRMVLGGGLITSWMKIPGFRNPFKGLIDDLISGPGESALLTMCGAGSPTKKQAPGFDYDQLPLPHYLSPGPVLPYSTARGCYWRKCAFCPETAEKNLYQPSDLSTVAYEIHRLKLNVQPTLIHFLDNALPPRVLHYLVQNPPGTPWYGFVRITAHLADPGFARKLKAAGCVMLKLGIESGDPDVLDALEKGIDLKIVSTALETLKAAGIGTYVYLLFGTPAESYESARKTLDFTLAHAPWIDFLNLAVFNLPAHSPGAEQLETVPFYEGDLSLYREFRHPEGWHRDRVRRFLSQEFKRPQPIRSILNNDPPFFTSNHAPFLLLNRPN